MLVVPLVRKTLPFSISNGWRQSTSKQVGGHEDHEPDDKHSINRQIKLQFNFKISNSLELSNCC